MDPTDDLVSTDIMAFRVASAFHKIKRGEKKVIEKKATAT